MVLGIGILLSHCLSVPAGYYFLVLVSILLSLILFPFLPPLVREGILLVGVVFLGAGYYQLYFTAFPPSHIKNLLSPEETKMGTLEGAVIETPEPGEGCFYLVVTAEKWWEKGLETKVCGKVRVRIDSESVVPQLGDCIRVTGNLTLPATASNPGEFDYRDYLARHKIFAVHYAFPERKGEGTTGGNSAIEIVGRTRINPLTIVTAKVLYRLEEVIKKTLPPLPGALLAGILIGEREVLPESLMEMFRDTGVIHIIAISGLQVGLIALTGFLILRFFRLPKKLAAGVNIGLVIFYAWMVGKQPSVVRSAVMSVAVLSSFLFDRETASFSILMLSAFLMMLVNPTILFEAGFQLSFSATAGLICLSPPIGKFLPSFPRWLKNLLSSSFGAQLAVLPLISHQFCRISVVSPVANLAIVPLATFITIVGFIAGLSGLVYLPLARLFNAANCLAITLLLKLVRFFSVPSWSSYWMRPLGGGGIILFYFAIFLLLKRLFKKPLLNNICRLLAVLILVIIFWCPFRGKNLECTFLSVGQGDAIFLRSPAGINLLLDTGGEIGQEAGERIILPFLHYRGVRKIDRVILSHSHEDHIGGLPTVVENFPIGVIFHNGEESFSLKYNLPNLMMPKGISVAGLTRGDEEVSRDLKIAVFHPSPKFKPDDPNNLSLVIKLIYKGISILFTGDIEKPAIKSLLEEDGKLSSTIVKVPHHGSVTSFTFQFLEAIRPQVAIISSGNKAGFPDEIVVASYRSNNCSVYQTNNQGAITIKTDGSRYRIVTFLPRKRGLRKIWEGLKIWRE